MSANAPSLSAGRRPVIFGEALFDGFPDGRRVLGGAPFNVAWHLQGFGLGPIVITRVGNDDEGRDIAGRMTRWGMSMAGVQVDDLHPTGRVTVRLADGEPTFDIESHQAYDYLAAEPARRAAAAPVGILYHGTLALREAGSWKTFRELCGSLRAPTICDVNLRAPWWTRERVDWCLRNAGAVKVNEVELQTLTNHPARSQAECEAAAKVLASQSGIGTLIVTRGADGAMLLLEGEQGFWEPAPAVGRLVDTVGAGDAFSAVVIAGILAGWEPAILLARAVRFAADVCTMPGATSEDPTLYHDHLNTW